MSKLFAIKGTIWRSYGVGWIEDDTKCLVARNGPLWSIYGPPGARGDHPILFRDHRYTSAERAMEAFANIAPSLDGAGESLASKIGAAK